jgi:hypothetical protein
MFNPRNPQSSSKKRATISSLGPLPSGMKNMNVMELKDQALSLVLKYGLSEEAQMIEQEERKLNQLIEEQR